MSAIVVLIGGGHASGKTTTAFWIKREILALEPALQIEVIDMNTYTDQAPISCSLAKNAAITVNNISIPTLKPSRFNFEDLKLNIRGLSEGSQKLIIVHGLYALYDKELRDMSQIKVFISGDADTRLIRWIRRDVLEDGVGLEKVINSYLHGSKQEMSDYIFTTKEQADVIMPRGAEANAVLLIVDGILPYLGMHSAAGSNVLRPSESYQHERFDNGKYYELN